MNAEQKWNELRAWIIEQRPTPHCMGGWDVALIETLIKMEELDTGKGYNLPSEYDEIIEKYRLEREWELTSI